MLIKVLIKEIKDELNYISKESHLSIIDIIQNRLAMPFLMQTNKLMVKNLSSILF